jgi:hypothetical protein
MSMADDPADDPAGAPSEAFANEDDDAVISVPLAFLASEQPLGGGEDDAADDDIVVTGARHQLAQDAEALMGGDMDADGFAADVIDTGREMVLWAFSPSSERVATAPPMADLTDPEDWLDALSELDLPQAVEAEIERLARAALLRMESGGEESARRDFARRLGALMQQTGIETLAVESERGGYDWVSFDIGDFAREQDGEPWAPPGSDRGSVEPRLIGVSLGRGGRVFLWPGALAPEALPQAPSPSEAAADG